jgi:hypothetical protein
MAEEKSIYRTGFNDQPVNYNLIRQLLTIEGVTGGYVLDNKKQELELIIDHPLSDKELKILKKLLPKGKYIHAYRLL